LNKRDIVIKPVDFPNEDNSLHNQKFLDLGFRVPKIKEMLLQLTVQK
jgi:hypothetical protein